MKTALVLNGPNLSLLGAREPAIYGADTLADVDKTCRDERGRLGLAVECRQSKEPKGIAPARR